MLFRESRFFLTFHKKTTSQMSKNPKKEGYISKRDDCESAETCSAYSLYCICCHTTFWLLSYMFPKPALNSYNRTRSVSKSLGFYFNDLLGVTWNEPIWASSLWFLFNARRICTGLLEQLYLTWYSWYSTMWVFFFYTSRIIYLVVE